MKRLPYIARYLLTSAFWSGAIYLNYVTASHSILPISNAFWLPSFVVPAALALLSVGFLWVALTIKPNNALFDAHISVVVRMPWVIWATRLIFCLSVITSGFAALIGPDRPDLLYSTPGWGVFWIVIGVWTLLAGVSLPRRRVEISPAGIGHSQVHPSLIPWEDVAEVKLRRLGFSRYVQVKFRAGARYRLATLALRWRKVRRLTVLPFFFGLDAVSVATALNMRRDVHAF